MQFWVTEFCDLGGRISQSPQSNIVVGVNARYDRDFSRQVYSRFNAVSPKTSPYSVWPFEATWALLAGKLQVADQFVAVCARKSLLFEVMRRAVLAVL